MEVLIADDSRSSLELLHHALSSHGYDVVTAENGAEALRILEERECQILVSDWMMPEMTGVELCRAIRQSDFSRYIYTILVTSRGESSDIIEGFAAGADDFLTKPFLPLELVARVRAGERIISLESRDLTIFAMAKLAESRDPDTGAHLERVRNYSRTLASYLLRNKRYPGEVNAEFVRLIYATSPLHDIGKVAIPDGVLLKKGKLTEEEFEVMKTHTLHGATTLDAALQEYPKARFLSMAREIAAHHHEKWDGSGYPDRLVGSAIPLAARIVAVADVYDALTSKRVYKEAFDHERARDLIMEGSGKHFDPELVDAFLACEESFLQIRERFQEEIAQSPLTPATAPV